MDRLLLDALKTEAGKTALLRSLKNVVITDSRNLDDLLFEHIDTHAHVSVASGDDYRLFSQQVRSLRRLTRSEEHLLARRLEFARERLRQLIDRTELPREARDRIIDRGITTGLLGSDENDGEASNDSSASFSPLVDTAQSVPPCLPRRITAWSASCLRTAGSHW